MIGDLPVPLTLLGMCLCMALIPGALSGYSKIYLDLKTPPTLLLDGEVTVLTCTTNMTLVSGQFTWQINGRTVRGGEGDNRRINVTTQYNNDSQTYVSAMFIKVSPRHNGTVTCTYTLPNKHTQSRNASIAVLSRPRVSLSSSSLSVKEGGDAHITCSATTMPTSVNQSNSTINITWYRQEGGYGRKERKVIATGAQKDVCQKAAAGRIKCGFQGITREECVHDNNCCFNNVIIGTHFCYHPAGKKLAVTNMRRDAVFTCEAENEAGTTRRTCRVTVIKKESAYCRKGRSKGLEWPIAAGGKTAKLPCSGQNGHVFRRCQRDGKWSPPDSSHCLPVIYEEMQTEVSDMLVGLGVDSDVTERVADKLVGLTELGHVTRASIRASVLLIRDLATIHQRYQDQPPSTKETQSIVQSCSLMTDKRHVDFWTRQSENEENLAEHVIESLDQYSKHTTIRNKATLSSKNIVMLVEPMNIEDKIEPLVYPTRCYKNGGGSWVTDSANKVTIPADTLRQVSRDNQDSYIVVSSTYYKDIHSLLGANTRRKETDVVNSKVMAISIQGLSPGTIFKTPISLFFENIEKPGKYQQLKCSALVRGVWSSDGCHLVNYTDQGVHCECHHMTNFAILLSHHRPNDPVLKTLSMIGCSFSVICMILTIVTYAVIWRPLRSLTKGNMFRSIMLMNLSSTLTAAMLVFMAGVERKSSTTEVWCVIIAASLHYLFLVAFATMLVTSVNLYWKLVSMSRGMRGDTIQDLLVSMAIAWGAPMIIVGISLAVTKSKGYGDEEYCWLGLTKGVIWAFIAPVLLGITVNCYILVSILVAKVKSQRFRKLSGPKQEEKVRSTVWSFVVLAPIVGTSWIIGVFAIDKQSVFMQYLFVLCNSIQGVLIFVFHCLLDQGVRKAFAVVWVNVNKRWTFTRLNKDNESSVTSQTRPQQDAEEKVISVDVNSPGCSGDTQNTWVNRARPSQKPVWEKVEKDDEQKDL